MKKFLLALAAVLLLTTATVPSFADGDPGPRRSPTPQCPITTCKPPVYETTGARSDCNSAAVEL